MRKQSRITLLVCILVILLTAQFTQSAAAQSDSSDCSGIVQDALSAVTNVCTAVGRDQLCYGNISVEASPRSNVNNFVFDQEGDIANISDVETLQLKTLDFFSDEWGVALLRVQANLPDSSPQNVSLLIFGNVNIDNQGSDVVSMTMTANTGADVRLRPAEDGVLLGTLEAGADVVANGRIITPSGEEWIRVDFQGGPGGVGWIQSAQLDSTIDRSVLFQLDVETARPYGPMEAFTFSSGNNDRPCEQAPDSGLMIQTPEGVGEISFLINEVDIQLGSTAYMQAVPNQNLIITLLDGQGVVTSAGVTRIVPAGFFVTVPLDANGVASGPPSQPSPYNLARLAPLSLVLNSGIFPINIVLPTGAPITVASSNTNITTTSSTGGTGGVFITQVCNPSALDSGASCPPPGIPPTLPPSLGGCVDDYPVIHADSVCFPQTPPARGIPGVDLPSTPWQPITIGARGCLALYHSDQTRVTWDIFRLDFSPFPNSVSDNVSQGPVDSFTIQPSRSYDGQWVAFTSDRTNENWEIWLGKADGSQQQRLTFNTGSDINPAFSNGNLVAWVSDRDGDWNIYMTDVSGNGAPRQLTSDPGADLSPFWSPDGQSVYFMSNRDGDFEIYSVNINTLAVTQITTNNFQDLDPIVSPDGNSVAWLRRGALGMRELWIWDIPSNETHQLAPIAGGDLEGAVFSSDSQLIAFDAFVNNIFDVYVVDVNSGVVKNLTRNPFITRAPAFHCDTHTVLYHSDQINQQVDIFQVDADPINADGPFNLEVRLTANSDTQIYVNDTPNDERGSNESRR